MCSFLRSTTFCRICACEKGLKLFQTSTSCLPQICICRKGFFKTVDPHFYQNSLYLKFPNGLVSQSLYMFLFLQLSYSSVTNNEIAGFFIVWNNWLHYHLETIHFKCIITDVLKSQEPGFMCTGLGGSTLGNVPSAAWWTVKRRGGAILNCLSTAFPPWAWGRWSQIWLRSRWEHFRLWILTIVVAQGDPSWAVASKSSPFSELTSRYEAGKSTLAGFQEAERNEADDANSGHITSPWKTFWYSEIESLNHLGWKRP